MTFFILTRDRSLCDQKTGSFQVYLLVKVDLFFDPDHTIIKVDAHCTCRCRHVSSGGGGGEGGGEGGGGEEGGGEGGGGGRGGGG